MQGPLFSVKWCRRALVPIALFLAQGAHAQTPVAIHDIMTNLPNSPLLGQQVSLSGIIVGVLSSGGFYVTAPDAAWDANAATAEGIEIFAAQGANPACAVVGNLVTVTGTVANGAAVNGAGTPGTGVQSTFCVVNGTGAVSGSIALTSSSSYAQDLPYTGMPVSNTVYNVIAPTSGITNPSTGLVISTGQFWVDLATPTNGHLFKSAGLALDNFYPPPPAPPKGSSPGIPTWSGNPQRLLVDSATFGGAPVDAGAGQVVTCTRGAGLTAGATGGLGVIDYSLGYNRLLLFKTTTCKVSGAIAPSITSPADSAHFHVGTLSLNNFAGSSSPVYATRLAKAALAIVNIFGKPEILSIQEVQDLATLQAIGDAASSLAGGATHYQAYWAPANDATNLSLGFLVDTSAVNVSKVYQVNVGDTFTTLAGKQIPLWERPPYVLEAGLLRAGLNYQVEVVNIETTSRDGIDDPLNGPNVWQRRGQQAEELSVFANAEQNRGQNLLIAGEFNAYSFSDGFVDITNTVDGNGGPAPGAVAQYEPSVTSPAMYNFVGSITVANSTYNVIENGNARSIEHILCSETQNSSASGSIYSYISFVTQPHWTTDFPAIDANDPTIAAGLTQRDGFVGAFLIPPVPTTATLTPATANYGSIYRGNSASQVFTFTNSSTFPSTVNLAGASVTGANPSDFTSQGNCSSLSQGASCTLTVTFSPLAAGTRTALLTVTSDSGANPSLTATLSGIGLDTTATLNPASAAFPTTQVGGRSAAQAFTFTNTSPLLETITSLTTSGDFQVAPNNCGTIAAGGTCVLQVTFNPTAAGMRTGTITVGNSSTANPFLTAALNGTGVSALLATPLPLDFGNVDLGGTSVPRPTTFTNYSQHIIGLTAFSVAGDFTFNNQCGPTLQPGAQCMVLVTFRPTALGARTGTLTVTTNDPSTPSVAVPLTGNGVDFSISLSPTSGTVIAGRELSFNTTITPLGGFAGTVGLSCSAPAAAGATTCLPAVNTLGLTAPVTTTVTINTTAQYTVIGYGGLPSGVSRWVLLAAGLSTLLLLVSRRKRALTLVTTLLVVSALNLGCSGKLPDRNANPTLPGTYTYTVTVSDGFLMHSATFALNAVVRN